jgi:hypothetical protein
MKYKKKTNDDNFNEFIEAVCFTPDAQGIKALLDFTPHKILGVENCNYQPIFSIKVSCGELKISANDYIIKDKNGFYSCKQELFEQIYKLALE